jgi:hypothetical protein
VGREFLGLLYFLYHLQRLKRLEGIPDQDSPRGNDGWKVPEALRESLLSVELQPWYLIQADWHFGKCNISLEWDFVGNGFGDDS